MQLWRWCKEQKWNDGKASCLEKYAISELISRVGVPSMRPARFHDVFYKIQFPTHFSIIHIHDDDDDDEWLKNIFRWKIEAL